MPRQPRYAPMSLVGGRLRKANHDGRLDDFLGPKGLAKLGQFRGAPVVMVHGFRYHPGTLGMDNPHISTFQHWRKDIMPRRQAIGFGWYSCPGSWRLPMSVAGAWTHGRWNTYRYAWDLAAVAGAQLAGALTKMKIKHPIDMLCHSLGSRVVLTALRSNLNLPVRRVVMLNGAELSRNGLDVSTLRRDVEFINLTVKTDDVLRAFGGLFAPGDLYAPTVGQAGLGSAALANWRDVRLDDPKVHLWASKHGWHDVRGDNPHRILDHWYSHKHPGNWPLILAALDGKLPQWDLSR